MTSKFGVAGSIARTASEVTKHDTNKNQFAYLYVGTAGDLKITTENGDVVTLNEVPAGSWVWVRTSLIWSTGTAASDIVGFN